ncbi:MAG: GDP-mannose 4,6-dehydratase [Dehalococcoidia bacterium]|nr:GDP-mannose 4,6-dehydratase [Dehalococcoidia bacterium]
MTGFSGFVGSYLAEYLLGRDMEVVGVDRRGSSANQDPRLAVFHADLREQEPIGHIVRETRPDLVFHLAAQANVPTSFRDPAGTLVGNIVSQLNLFQAIIDAKLDCPILIPGSNEEYGRIEPDELPVRESNPLRPTNPYAVSKVAQDLLAYQYSLTHGLKCIRVRAFNHTGPRQTPDYVIPSLAKQVAEAEAGQVPPIIKVGNLEAQRDFTDVRDIVRAYHLALLNCIPGDVYNLGSGRCVSVQEILDFFLARSPATLSVRVKKEQLRSWDNPRVVCDSTKFRSRTGWQPEIPLEQTLTDVLEYWREMVASRPPG